MMRTRPPLLLVASALVLVVLGVLITPDRLIELGPFRRSLTFDDPYVVKTALIEVAFIRVSCFVFGTLLLGSAVFWRRVLASGPVRAIMSHRVEQTGYYEGPGSLWNLSLLVTTMAWLLGISYIAFGGIVLPGILTEVIDKDEGPIEDLTALIFLMCSVVFGFVAIRYRARRIERFFLGLFSAMFFLFFGEEIDWGQVILWFDTPDALKEINVHGKTNIRGFFGYAADHLFILGVFCYGVMLPFLRAYNVFWGKLYDKIGLPVPSPGLAYGFLLISLTHIWTVGAVLTPSVALRVAELREFLTSIGFLLLARDVWIHRLRIDPIDTLRMYPILRWDVALALLVLLISAAAFAVVASFFYYDFETLDRLSREDGPIQNMTAFLFGLSCIGFCIVACKSQFLRKNVHVWRYWMTFAWAALMLFFAGEELSWGQRIFGLKDVDIAFFEDNVQGETNIHNLPLFHKRHPILLDKFVWITGVILPLIAFNKFGRHLIQTIAFPVAPFPYFSLFVLVFLFSSRMIFDPTTWMNPIHEAAELTLAVAMSCFAVHGILRPDSLFRADRCGPEPR